MTKLLHYVEESKINSANASALQKGSARKEFQMAADVRGMQIPAFGGFRLVVSDDPLGRRRKFSQILDQANPGEFNARLKTSQAR